MEVRSNSAKVSPVLVMLDYLSMTPDNTFLLENFQRIAQKNKFLSFSENYRDNLNKHTLDVISKII